MIYILYLEQYISESNKKTEYIQNIEACVNFLEKYLQQNSPLYNYTDHSVSHSLRISQKLLTLYDDMFTHVDNKIKLNDSELYTLIMSIYLHDIGMELVRKDIIIKLFEKKDYKNEFMRHLAALIDLSVLESIEEMSDDFYTFIRDKHHIISAMWIMNNDSSYFHDFKIPMISEFTVPIAVVCFAHNEDFNAMQNNFFKNYMGNNLEVQTKVISYLLRVGDSLDADVNRCKIDSLKFKDICESSKVHWYKHYYTKSLVTKFHEVKISYEFPDDPNWHESIETYFINNTEYWIKNNNDELLKSKIFENNIRENYLKYHVISEKDYRPKECIDEKTKKFILNDLKKNNNLIIVNKNVYISIYIENFNSQLIQNKYDTSLQKSFLDIFVQPRLFEFSQHQKKEKVEAKKNKITIDNIMESKYYYAIRGTANSGKTSLLRYLFIQYSKTDKIPFIINFESLTKKSNKNLLYENIKQITIERLNGFDLQIELENGNCIILVDDVNEDSTFYSYITDFISRFPNNKLIYTSIENIHTEISLLERGVLNKNNIENSAFVELYIHSFGIGELKTMISKWFSKAEGFNNLIVLNSMQKFIFQNKLPRTPLVYSLFLSIIEKDNDFSPLNFSSLLEKFTEIYLGKFNIFPNISHTYPYERKLYILEELANYMIKTNSKQITYAQYDDFISKFSKKTGNEINSRKLVLDLIISNIIIDDTVSIKFSYDCFLHFFYSKYIKRNNLMNVFIDNINIRKYSESICFYAGLQLNCEDLVIASSNIILDFEDKDLNVNEYISTLYSNYNKSFTDIFDKKSKNDFEIKSEIKTLNENNYLMEDLYDSIPDSELSDEENDVFKNLIVLCRLLKNTEIMDYKVKSEVLELCFEFCSYLFVFIYQHIEKKISETIKEENRQNDFNDLNYNLILILTLVFQSLFTNELLTTSLMSAINDINNKENNLFVRFLIVIMQIELSVNKYEEYVEKFIDQIECQCLLECLCMNLELIYQEKSFASKIQEERFCNLIRKVIKKIGDIDKSNGLIKSHINNKIDVKISNLKRKKDMMTKQLII